MCELIQKSQFLHRLALSATLDNRYWQDFMRLNDDYVNILNKEEYKKFLAKSQLDKNITMPQYVQFAAETCVVYYIMRKFNAGFCYEPQYKGEKNPECSFKYNDRIINIEVKTPDLTKRIMQENDDLVKLYCADRLPRKDDLKHLSVYVEKHLNERVRQIDRLDNKLKDYLVSAHQKFPKSENKYFNILVIALDIIKDLDEWYSYIFGSAGVFTSNSYIREPFDNVDAIMLTDVQHGHIGGDFKIDVNLWDLNNYVSLLFLNPNKARICDIGNFFTEAIDIFGTYTKHFIKFQLDRHMESEKCHECIRKSKNSDKAKELLEEDLIIHEKLFELNIISEWYKTLSKKVQGGNV